MLHLAINAIKFFTLNGQALTWLQTDNNGIVFVEVYKGLDNLQTMINIGYID